MITHGIMTSKADCWLHLFPMDGKAYTYNVEHMRWLIETEKPVVTISRSKDGSETGAGYLIKKSACFIVEHNVPKKHCPGDWAAMTQRQSGLRGERIARFLLECGIIKLPRYKIDKVLDRKGQIEAVDCVVSVMETWCVEIKTETIRSHNLFVQTQEGGHKVHQLLVNGSVEERPSKADWEG